MARTPMRPRHISRRPEDQPIYTNPSDMDFEKRRLFVPPSFIDQIVLKGGDEYVKASDLAIIVNAIVENFKPTLDRIEAHLALGSDVDLTEEEIE